MSAWMSYLCTFSFTTVFESEMMAVLTFLSGIDTRHTFFVREGFLLNVDRRVMFLFRQLFCERQQNSILVPVNTTIYYFYFTFDDCTFRSFDHLQVTFTKRILRWQQCIACYLILNINLKTHFTSHIREHVTHLFTHHTLHHVIHHITHHVTHKTSYHTSVIKSHFALHIKPHVT
jgi:hypothetical protein